MIIFLESPNPANNFQAVKITTLPGLGTLSDNGTPVSAGAYVSVADINAGHLVFTPAANATGAPYDDFTFQVQDDGGTDDGGIDTDPTPRTMTINVMPSSFVNHAPTGTSNTVTTPEDTAYTLSAGDFGFSDPNDSPANNLRAVKITTVPSTGWLTDNGVPVSAGAFVSASHLNAGLLQYNPDQGAHGSPAASFTFQVQDDGGTANGGANPDPTPRTMSINVSADRVDTSTTLTSSASPSTFGDEVTFTATVSTGSDSPTGTVSFYEGTTFLGMASLSMGSASLTTSALLAGTHSVTAVYNGDNDFETSSAAPLSQTVTKMPPTLNLLSSLNPTPVGTPVTFTANLMMPDPPPVPATGQVQFWEVDQNGANLVLLGTVTLDSSGNASLTLSSFSAGLHHIKAVYLGDDNFTSPLGTLDQTITDDDGMGGGGGG